MAHRKRNAKMLWRNKRANHGRKPCRGKEKSALSRDFRRKRGGGA